MASVIGAAVGGGLGAVAGTAATLTSLTRCDIAAITVTSIVPIEQDRLS